MSQGGTEPHSARVWLGFFFACRCGNAQAGARHLRLTFEMAELLESSGLHSLASLREHEKGRAQQQAEAARARAEAEQRARKEAEREAARIQHERRLAERSERAESAQHAELLELASSWRAEFDRAEGLLRSSAELRLSLERERKARQGVELGLTSRLLHQRLLTCASAALCVGSWLAAAGLYFGALRPGAERAVATAQQSLLTERRARSEAQEREARSAQRADELSSRVSALALTLREERERRAAQSPALGPTRKPVATTRLPLVVPPVKPCRDDGDPLNPCLKR
jgi:hypothetical protein